LRSAEMSLGAAATSGCATGSPKPPETQDYGLF
jgi:hypothetical protein